MYNLLESVRIGRKRLAQAAGSEATSIRVPCRTFEETGRGLHRRPNGVNGFGRADQASARHPGIAPHRLGGGATFHDISLVRSINNIDLRRVIFDRCNPSMERSIRRASSCLRMLAPGNASPATTGIHGFTQTDQQDSESQSMCTDSANLIHERPRAPFFFDLVTGREKLTAWSLGWINTS